MSALPSRQQQQKGKQKENQFVSAIEYVFGCVYSRNTGGENKPSVLSSSDRCELL